MEGDSVMTSVLFQRGLFTIALLGLVFSSPTQSQEKSAHEIVLVLGLEGAEEYREVFQKAAGNWKTAAEKADVPVFTENTSAGLEKRLGETAADELWIVLIGHGTFDGREAKFNVEGKDFTDRDLAVWVKGYPGELSIINTASASGSFVPTLSKENRIVITATKSPAEYFFTRFGTYFSEAIGGLPAADFDNDQQVSLLECFLYASRQVEEFFQKEGRIATEHALIDDTGDKMGTRSDWFEGITAVKVAEDGADPDGERARQKVLVKNDFERQLTAEQIKNRDILERKVRELRRKKDELDEGNYYRDLEKYLRQLAEIYREVEQKSAKKK